jgi:hypothetical protein
MIKPKQSSAQITTFYSYKGGTGRTMLLANVAWILASAGKRVLAIDWDLEAPGLHQYFHPFLIDPRLEATDGLIDMVVEYSREAVTPEEQSSGSKWLDHAADVSRFVVGIDWSFPDDGLLHLLAAGRQNASFSVRVNTFHWSDFYVRLNGGAFLELVKTRLRNDYQYDHVLIDSRTGVSDTSGICTVQMPDRLVVCFTASEQSIQGSAGVAASAWAQWARFKSANPDGKTNDSHGHRIFPILMRIEPSEKDKLDAARARVRELFGGLPGLSESNDEYWNRAEVAYWPFYAFEEVLAVFGDRFRTDTSLLAACEHVASLITDGEVDRLAAIEPPQREQVLAAYERRAGRKRADAIIVEQPQQIEEGRSRTERAVPLQGERRWFLSCNSRDLSLAERLRASIGRRDSASRVFLAPDKSRPGVLWLPELQKEISEATGFILLIGESGVGASQMMEYYEALDKRAKSPGFPVLIVLLEGQPAPGLPFLHQLPWVVTTDPGSDKSFGQLMDAVRQVRPATELWRHTAPYRGLAAMTEADSEFFFGRERETEQVIRALVDWPNDIPLLLGNSGVGKSSLAQAGVLAALMREGWPETATAPGLWPQQLGGTRHWCFLTLRPGADPLRALLEAILRVWQFDVVDPNRLSRRAEWTEAFIEGRTGLRDLLDATEGRLQELGQTKPPAFMLYVDQGEELYVRGEERRRRRFSEVLADGLGDPRLRAMMSMRSDFLGALQNDPSLFAVHRKIDVPPLREAELREVVSRPAEFLGARFETDDLANNIARYAAEESTKDASTLPLLSYFLDDMWSQMVRRGDGVLRFPALAFEFGAVLGQRAEAFLAHHPGSEGALRRIFTLKLATVREDGEPTRRRAARSEFTEKEWRLVSELTDHPNRLLVTATSESGETYAEAASEAIFRRWERLRDWIAAEREFLAWRSGLEAARRAWAATPNASKSDALLMGARHSPTRKAGWRSAGKTCLPSTERS